MSRSKKRSSCRRNAFFLPDLAFRAGKQAADVVGVEENDQSRADHQVYQLLKIDPGEKSGVHAPNEEEEQATHHRRQAAYDGAERNIARNRDSQRKRDGADQKGERGEDQHRPRTGGDAASALKAYKDGKAVPKQRRQACDCRPPTGPMQKRNVECEQNGHDALREVQYKYDKCWKFTECP